MSKLTLHIAEELVNSAKSEAASRQVSVSKLVSDYFTTLAAHKSADNPDLSRIAPRTRRLAGCISETNADLEDYINYLERKHS